MGAVDRGRHDTLLLIATLSLLILEAEEIVMDADY